MSIVKSIAKFLSLLTILGLFVSGFFFVILPNKSFFDNVSSDFTETILGLEPNSNWKSKVASNPNIKTGYYIKPNILGIQYPKIWITSKDSIHQEIISEWKIYDASF